MGNLTLRKKTQLDRYPVTQIWITLEKATKTPTVHTSDPLTLGILGRHCFTRGFANIMPHQEDSRNIITESPGRNLNKQICSLESYTKKYRNDIEINETDSVGVLN